MTGDTDARPGAREEFAAKKALWSALDAAATPVSMLATLAALVRALSAPDYGILVIALAVSGLSMAVNPAIAATTTKFVSEVSGQRDTGGRTAAGVITVSLITVSIIDLALILVTTVFKEPLTEWLFGAATASNPHVGTVLVLAVLAIGIQQLDTIFAAAIRGLERFRRQALIEIFSKTALTIVVIFVAWHTQSLAGILIAQSAVYMVSMLLRAVALRRLLPDKHLFELSGWERAGSLYRYGGWMWLAALAGVAYTSADRIIVGRSLGAAAAGQYNVYAQITQLIHFVPSSLFAFSFPAFSRLAAQGSAQRGEISRSYWTYLLGISATALGVALAMTLSWKFLLKVLVGGLPDGDQGKLAALLGANFLLLAASVVPYYLLLALGRSRTVSLTTSASMLASLALMIVLVPRYGLQGAALGRLAYGIGALLLLHLAHHALKRT